MASRWGLAEVGAGGRELWDFTANVADGALFALAMSLASQQTVLPVLVRNVGGGNIAVGLIPVVWVFGFNFPQILIASRAQRGGRKKVLLLKTALLQRIPWLFLGLAVLLFFDGLAPGVALAIFFGLFACAAVAGSVNLPVWFDVIAALTPVHYRGRLFGLRSIFGSLLGLLGGGVVAYVLAALENPTGFGVILLLAFGVMMVSYLFLISLSEPAHDGPEASPSRLGDSQLVRILRTQPNFRRFLVADALRMSSLMGAAFLTVHAFSRFGLDDAYAGFFTVAMMGTTTVSGLVLGTLADRIGHRVNLMISSAATTVGSAVALLASTVEVYSLAFICLSLTLSVEMISRLPFIAELAPEGERPSVVALANLITGPFVLWGVAGGWLADQAGYDTVFVLAGIFAFGSFLFLLLTVDEPRPRRGVV